MEIEDVKTAWVKLGQGNFEVVIADFALTDGESAVVVRGDGPLSADAVSALSRAGFRKIAGPRSVWARRGGTFKPSELVTAFRNLSRVERRPSETRILFRGESPFVPSRKAVEAAAPRPAEAVQPPVPDSVSPAKTDTAAPPSAVPAPSAPVSVSPPGKPEDTRKDNAFQSVYRPASRLGTPIALIPVNMRDATASALAKIEETHGPIDEFLASRLGYDLEKLEKVLSPEQIDASAMAIAATLRGREMILADQTGLGKGRVVAAVMLAAARAGKTVIFVTEKANLFSDIFRDLMDIDGVEAMGKPFLMNSGSRVIDVTSVNGEFIAEALPGPDLRKVIKSKKLPEGCRFLMCTYSQFNRAGSDKEKFLTEVAKDAYVVVDEAHNAAGDDSNTSVSLENGLAGAWGVMRSSATFARRAENLLSYPKVLPPGMRSEDVRIALQAGGNAMAEAAAQYLAEDGVLIRREHDLSGIRIEVMVDDERKDRNMEYSDALAPILSRLARLQRMVDDEIETRNEDAQKGGGKAASDKWYSANFGSRRAPLLRQFLTALSVEYCIDRCVETLLAGEKPVVVIEQTMETLMRELSETRGGTPDDEEEDAEFVASMQGKQAPDFRDALSTMLDRIMHMTVRRGKEDPEKVEVDDPFIKAERASIQAIIDRFPSLSLSPIDDIRDRIEAVSAALFAEGRIERPWKADEISARSLRVTDGVYTPMKKVDRNDVIVAFNSGGIDALVITRAASTGLSLHASEKAKDQRRRKMIELQIPANVVERVQFWGRVNRRGQVSVPSFETLSTGLPSQMRTLAMNNRKVESLSATVSANARTATAMDVPDMIDSVGNEVAQRILTDQPRIAEAMFIAMRNIDPDMAEQELYYVNKFLQGFCYLTSEENEELFAKLLEDYTDAVKGLEAQGKTPRGVRELAGEWREVSRERYEEAVAADGPVFGRPVDIVVMEGEVERYPVTAAKLRLMMSESRTRLGNVSGKPAGPYFDAEVKAIAKNRRGALQSALSGRYISVDAALRDKEANSVKAASDKLARLTEIVQQLSPGLSISVPDDEGNVHRGIIVDVRAPDAASVHHPGRWTIRYACPGDTSVTDISVATVMREAKYQIVYERPRDVIDPDLRRFDSAPRGLVKTTKTFLDGNFVRSMLVATEISAGAMVSYRDSRGNARRSVLIHDRGLKALSDRTAKIRSSGEAMRHVENGLSVFTDYRARSNGLIVQKTDTGYAAFIPRGKEWERIINDGPAVHAGAFRADKGGMLTARLSDRTVQPFLDAIFGKGLPLYFDNRTIAAKQNRFAAGAKQQTASFQVKPRF